MNRSEAISNIESLFPIDSEYPDTNEVGKKLLMQAIECIGWRKLNDDILNEYAKLCIDEENRQANRILNKYGVR